MDDINEMKDLIKDLTSLLEESQEQIKSLNKEVRRLNEKITMLNKEKREDKWKIENLESQINNFNRRSNTQLFLLNSYKKRINKLKNKTKKRKDDKDEENI